MVVAENGAAGWAGIVEDGRGRPSLHRFETGDARRYIDSKRGEGRPSLHRFETGGYARRCIEMENGSGELHQVIALSSDMELKGRDTRYVQRTIGVWHRCASREN